MSTIFDDVRELLDPKGVQVKPFVSRDGNAAPVYGTAVTYKPALALTVDRRIKDANGDTVILAVTAYLPPKPPVDKRSLLIFRGTERRIYEVNSYPDPDPTFVDGFQEVLAQ